LADTLSRTVPKINSQEVASVGHDPMSSVCDVVFRTDKVKNEYQEATKADDELQCLKHYVLAGWPSSRKNCPFTGRKYWNIRGDISICDELLFYRDRLIIPLARRPEILSKLHTAHLGVNKTIYRAKQTVYWPGMSKSIEDLISACQPCQKNASTPKTQPLAVTTIPPHPYHTVGTDLFSFEGDDYLLTVDYYSKWINIDKLSSTTSAQVVKCLLNHFVDFGIPKVLRSDNGPQYSCNEFRKCMDWLQIEHITSSPGYPQSSGQAEAMVKSAKNLLTKCKAEGKPYLLGLIELRNTPISADIPSLATLLQGRLLPSQ
jgi:transposase InsO family protein